MIVLSRKIKLYIVDIEEKTVSRLEELLYDNPQLGIKLIGHSHNYTSCVNDLSRAKEADVYLISAFLPDQMGIYLIEKIKKVNPDGKIIIMVSSSTRNQAEVAKDKGADEIILKPFKAKHLIDTIYQLANDTDIDDEDELFGSEESASTEDTVLHETPKHREVLDVPVHSDDLPDFVDSEYRDLLDENHDETNAFLKNYDLPTREKEELNRKRFEIANKEVEEIEEPEEPTEDYNFSSPPPPTSQPSSKRSLFDMYADNSLSSNLYQDPDDLEGQKPNFLIVFSSTSSAGKTSLLVNTAIAVNKFSEYKPKICIVDFNLAFPSVLYKFHQDELIMPTRNLFDIVEDKEILDEELIKQALVTHEPTGIKILETPPDAIRDISIINRDVIIPLFEKLRGMFDLVLVDTSTNLRSDASTFPLTISDKNIVIMEPDLGSLLHTRKFITMLKTVEGAIGQKFLQKSIYILNKDNPKTGIHVDTVKKTIHNNSVRLSIPEDVNITHLSNNGQFVIHSNSGIAREIKELARIAYPLEKELSLSNPSKGTKKKAESKFIKSLFKR
ncbi:hypothetical protein CN918_27310 [Priestia megaterium]|nr:hypothetical protein CN918_27310 [Priestia megaterium]